MHTNAFEFMKTPQSRLKDVVKLRALYSSSEMTRQNKMNRSMLDSSLKLTFNDQKEQTKKEVKETLLSKIKEFRDLIHLYQRRNH